MDRRDRAPIAALVALTSFFMGGAAVLLFTFTAPKPPQVGAPVASVELQFATLREVDAAPPARSRTSKDADVR